MGQPRSPISILLFLFWLDASWEAHVPQPVTVHHPATLPSNATVFSHVYTIKLAGDVTEGEGLLSSPQEALGPPGSSRGGGLFEHTLEGPDQEHVVFTHRINLPPQTCGCPPGTEDTRELLRRLQALENEVRTLRNTCRAGGGCCPAAAGTQASTGQTDIRTLCSHHGSFDLSRCQCDCEPGWGGPTCAEPACPGGCGGSQRGKCVNGRCQCRPGYSGVRCEEPPSCPDDCNDQGRCVDGRCQCFQGYIGPSCSDPACPEDCQGRGKCVSGRCVCDPGYSGADCGSRACPSNCNRRGECRDGRCVCEPGFTGPACGTKACPNHCHQRGRCLKGGVCECHKGYTGPDCGQRACPEDCSGHGECQNGVCLCHDGYSGDDCATEIPSIGIRVSNRDETSFRLEWNRPEVSVDGYEIHVVSTKERQEGESIRLPGTETVFERRGLKPGEEYAVTIRTEKGQRYGPPVTQTVRTRVAPPYGLQSSRVTEDSMTLQWEPPSSHPDGYILSYVPVGAPRPVQATKRVELPATPETVTLRDLESNTRYRLTLIARQNGENSRATSIVVSTTALAATRPPTRRSSAPSPSFHPRPVASSSEPDTWKPGHGPSNSTSRAKELFLRKMTQNISEKLSSYNGTLLERLESYLRATNFPLQGNRTIEGVARDIYIYLIRWKPKEFQERVEERLIKETSNAFPQREPPIGGARSVFSEGYLRPEHAKPSVVTSSPDGLEVALDGVRGVSDNVVIRFRNTKDGEGGEVVVPGDTSRAVITGLDPGTTYQVEIHGVVKGHSSKSYSFIASTAPAAPTPAKTQPIPTTTLSPEVPLTDLAVTDVSPNSLRVTWSAPPDAYRSFALQYRDPKSSAPPGEIRVPGTERSVDVVGLSPRTEYELQLHGEKPSGRYDAPLTTKASTAAETQKPTLGGISVLEITDHSARLSWDVATGTFDSFLIQYKDTDGKPKSVPVSGDSREATLSDLVPSRKYKFNVYGLVGRKRFGPVSTEAVTAKPERKLTAPPSLGELSASNTTSDSVRLSWSVPSGSFDSFVIQYKDAEGRPQVLPLEGDAREVTVPSLAPSRRYRFNLYGIASRKRLGPATADITTAAAQETAPRPVLGDLSVYEATSDSVRLTWTVPEGHFDSFLLQYQDPEGKEQTQPVNRDSQEATVSNLMPSQAYRFHLYGISGDQRLGPVSVDAVTVPTAATQPPKTERPDVPPLTQPSLGELSASGVTSNSVRLSWTVPAGGFDSFLIQYKDSEGKTQMLPAKGSSRQTVVSNLAPSHRYKFNLYGVSGRKRSGPVSANATTAPQEAEEPAEIQPSLGELSASNVTSDSVRLSWTVPSGNFDSFLIQYKDVEGKPQVLPLQGGAREALVPHLAPSHRYKFNLYGVSGHKRSAPISTDATTASQEVEEQVSIQPSLGELSVSDVTVDSVRLSWTVRTGSFDSFLVQYKDAAGKPQALPVEGESRQVLVTSLAPSHRYKFNLFGVSGGERSVPLSTEATTASTATSQEGEAAAQPSLGELSVTDVSTHSARLSWTVRSGSFDSFLIQYKDAEGKLQTLPVERDFRDIIVPNLIPSRRYKFNLYGVSSRKRSAPVSTDATTAPVPSVAPGEVEGLTPAQPRLGELSASNISSHSLQLSWTLLAGNVDSFLIQYKDAAGKLQAQPVKGGGTRQAAVSNLVPSRRYRFNLYGVSGLKRIGPISTEAVTAPLMEKPTAPIRLGELTAANAMPNSLDLSWTVEEGDFDSFIVQYRDAQGKPQALPVDGSLRSLHLHDLAPSHRYKFNLYGILGRKRLGPIFTEGETAPLPTTPPPQPTLGELLASNVTSDSARLSWTVPTGGFDSFLIQYKDAEGKPQSLPVEGELREVMVPSLVPSRRYKFNLYGVSGRKRVGPVSTDTVTASLPEEPPSLGELFVSDVTSDSVHLSWTVRTGSFETFLIQYKDAQGKPHSIPVEGVFRELAIPNLVPSRRYKFNLYGLTGRNKRLGPVSTDTVTASPPAETVALPSLGQLSVSNVTTDSASLSWTVQTGSFDSFLIQYKDAEGKAQALPLEGSSRETTIPGLSPSRRYKFNLIGLAGRKRIGPVSADAVTAPRAKKEEPSKPSLGEFSVSDVTSNSALLSWTVATGHFDSFLIQYKDVQGKLQALPVEGNSREVTVSDLTPSHRYKFNLFGLSGRKRLGPVSSEATTVKPEEEEQKQEEQEEEEEEEERKEEEDGRHKPQLGELMVSEANSDSVRLSWSVPNGSFDSFLVQYKDGEDDIQTLPVDGVSREVTVLHLVPSQRYQFELYGISKGERLGPVSTNTVTAPAAPEQQVQVTTPPPPEPKLGELSVSEVTGDSVRLSWDVPTGTYDSFLVQYVDAEDNPQEIPVDKGTSSIVIYYLVPTYRYIFYLYGVSGQRHLGPISVSVVTATTGDEKQQEDEEVEKEGPGRMEPRLGELSVSKVTRDAARLSWTVPVGSFDSFSVQYKDAEGRPQALPVGGEARDILVPNLSPSHKYKFNLYGISGKQRLGPISATAVTTARAGDEHRQEVGVEADKETPLGTEVPRLGKLSVSEVTRDAARLSWTVPVGSFDSFSVQYKDAEGRPQALPVGGDAREVTVPNLAPSHKYKFNLFGISGKQRVGPISAGPIMTASTRDEKQQDVREVEEEEGPGRTEPRLGELSVSEVTRDAARLSWTVPVGSFDSFSVQYKDAEGRPQALPVGGDAREVTVPNLAPSHKYKFNLFGISGKQRLGPISAGAVTTASTGDEKQQDVREVEEEEGPGRTEPRLGELSVSEVTRDAARLSWTVPVGSFDSFSVQYKDTEGRPQALPVGGDAREVTVPNLAPSHKYKFNLFGISGKQRLGPISAGAVTTASTGDEKQQDVREVEEEEGPGRTEPRLGELSVSEVTRDAARLSWTVPVGSFDSFSVQYKDAEGRPQALPVGGDAREVTVPNLAPSHKYKFNLFGISGKQRVGPISAGAVTTAAETPGPAAVKEKKPPRSVLSSLGEVAVSEVTPDSLLLSWSIPKGSFDSFLIQYKDAAGKLQDVPVDGAMRSLHLYNLTPSQRYKFHFFGLAGNKRLGPVSIDTVTAPEPPQEEEEEAVLPRMGDLSVSTVTSDSVGLSWSVPAGHFDSFLLQYKDTEGKPQVLPLNGDTRDVTVPNLAPSQRYKFNLYGLSRHKQLGPLSTDAVTGPRAQPEKRAPLKLGELSAHDITAESVLLNWTVETGHFDSFIIQYRDAEGKPHALPVDGSLRSLRLHDLLPSHQYRFNLYGVYGRKRFGPVSTEALTAPLERVAPPQPSLGEFSASDINGTSIRLSWNVVTGNFDSFIVQYQDAEGKPQALPVGKNLLYIIISNLVPSRKYRFNLYGIAGRKRIGPISVDAVTAEVQEPEIRPTLGDLSISEVTQDSVRLSWTVSAGNFDSFLTQYKDAEGRPQSIPVEADARTVVISDLTPSHRYKFNLYGVSGRKRFGPISTDAVTAFPEADSKPPTILLDHLIVSEVTPTSLQLTWEVPEGEVDSFLIRCKESLLGSGRSPPPAKEVTVAGDKRSAVLRGLTPNTEYSLTVYGIRDGSEVANLNTGARTSGLELDSPRDLRFSDIRETSVVANWRPPTSRIDRYKVSVQPSDGGEPRSIAVDGSKLRTTLENLTPGTSYEVTVVSIRGFEESEPLVGYVTTVPDGPSDLRAVDVTDSSAVLTWHPPMAEMNNYIVTYGPIGGPRASESVPGNRVQLQLSGLHRDTEYRASVYGEKDGNRSSPASATFTTGADGPSDLRAREISARSARLTWSPPRAPPGGYLLSYEGPSGQSKEIPLDASVTSYELQDLIPSSRYQVQVQALRRGTPTAPTSTSFTTEHMTYPFPRDCSEESMNGPRPSRVTTIYLGGNRERPVQVYCDMETDGGGWIVFQRRMNGETDFWRDWQDYATGFGNLTREFWLGNDALHQLTSSGDYELRVDLRAGNESVYATYQSFRVDPPADHYRLHLGSYNGTAGDAFSYHSGSVFSTRDRDPNRLIIPCAVSYRGAWWYRNCHYTNLNGLYANNRDHQGVNWFNWKGFEFSIPFTEMKLRPRGFQPLRRA